MATFSLEALARKAPNVSFVHSYPGLVKSNLVRGEESTGMAFASAFLGIFGSLLFNDMTKECGERHTFFATSAKYPALKGMDGDASVSLKEDEILVADRTNEKNGSGVYTVDDFCECGGPKVVKLLSEMRDEKMVEKVWGHMEEDFERITGCKEGV